MIIYVCFQLFVMILVLLASVSPSGMVQAQAATSVSISKKKATLSVGEKLTLSLKGAKGSITWDSSKPKVAKITKNGKITVVDDSELSAKGLMRKPLNRSIRSRSKPVKAKRYSSRSKDRRLSMMTNQP